MEASRHDQDGEVGDQNISPERLPELPMDRQSAGTGAHAETTAEFLDTDICTHDKNHVETLQYHKIPDDELFVSQISSKRIRSPSIEDNHPAKRHQSEPIPRVIVPKSFCGPIKITKERFDPEKFQALDGTESKTETSSRPQTALAARNEPAGNADQSVTPLPQAAAGSRIVDGFGSPFSFTFFDSPDEHNSQSKPFNKSQHILSSIEAPGPFRPAKTPSPRPEEPSLQSQNGRRSPRPLSQSSMRITQSPPRVLRSPIWNEENELVQRRPQRQLQALRTTSNILHTRGYPGTPAPCPFWDGGLPGEGSDSSDDGTMLSPTVRGRQVFLGGTRNETLSPTAFGQHGVQNSTLQHEITKEGMWRTQDKVGRRKKKLEARRRACLWRKASKTNNLKEVSRLEGEAVRAEDSSASVRSRSRTPQPHTQPSQYKLPSDPQHQLQGRSFTDPSIQSRRPSRPLRFTAGENLRHQSWSASESGPTHPDRSSRTSPLTAANLFNHHRCLTSANGMNASDEESSPMLRYFRNSQQTRAQSYQKSDHSNKLFLPDDSISSHGRSGALFPANDAPRLLNLSRPSPTSDIDGSDVNSPRPPQTPRKPSDRPDSRSPLFIDLCSSVETTPAQRRSINLCSSAEVTPPYERSVPMKDRMRASFTPKTKLQQPPRMRTFAARNQTISKEDVDPEGARQQMYADRIIAGEIGASHHEIFGDDFDFTLEEQVRKEAIKKEEEEKKRQTVLKEKLWKEEEARIVEDGKMKAQEEARKTKRLQEEREAKWKKAKRDVERRKQKEHEERLKEQKRQNAERLIQEAREKAKAAAKEKHEREERRQNEEIRLLKLANLRQEKMLLEFQARGLISAMPDSKSKTTSATDAQHLLEAEDSSLFVSDDVATNFRAEQARRRFEDDKARVEARLQSRFSSATPRSSSAFTESVQKRPRNSQAPRTTTIAKSCSDEDSGDILSQPPILRNAIESDPERELEVTKPKTRKPPPKRTPRAKAPKTPQSAAFPAFVPTQRAYTSAIKTIEEASREEAHEKKRADDEEKKQKRNEAKRCANRAKSAAKYRQKVINERMLVGKPPYSEGALDDIVDQHMDELDIKYRRLQEKKAGNGPGNQSLPSSFQNSPSRSQSIISYQSFLDSQSNSQPALSPKAPSEITPSINDYRAGSSTIPDGVTEPDISFVRAQSIASDEDEEHFLKWKASKAASSHGAFARAAAKTTVADFTADTSSDESEDDADPVLEAALAAKLRKTVVPDGKVQENDEHEDTASELEFEKDFEAVFSELQHKAAPQTRFSSPSPPHSTAQQPTSRPGQAHQTTEHLDIAAQKASFSKREASDPAHAINLSPEIRIRIYSLAKTTTAEGTKGDPEILKSFTSREEANDMGKSMFNDLRSAANHDEAESKDSLSEENLYEGKIVYNQDNVTTVSVTAKIEPPSKYHGIDVEALTKLHGEKVWVIKRELKKRAENEKGEVVITNLKEDANQNVYTDRKQANHAAAEDMIEYIKPLDGNNVEHALEWAGNDEGYSKQIREIRDSCNSQEGALFAAGVVSQENTLSWMDWDDIDYSVEVRKTVGPKN